MLCSSAQRCITIGFRPVHGLENFEPCSSHVTSQKKYESGTDMNSQFSGIWSDILSFIQNVHAVIVPAGIEYSKAWTT